MMITKEDLHRLVDELPESEVYVAGRYLEYLRNAGSDPFLHALMNAPIDDEPETEEERQAVAEAEADVAAGRLLSLDDVKRELGL